MPEAFGKTDVPGCRSMTSDPTPCRASSAAIASPAGPAPTTRTGTSWVDFDWDDIALSSI